MSTLEFAPYLLAVFVVAGLYGSVGHGGASGYIAVLSLAVLSKDQVSSTALTLNLFVAGIAWCNYFREKHFQWRLTWPFLVTSVPCAYFGARFKIEEQTYFVLLGLVLLYAAGHLIFKPDKGAAIRPIGLPSALVFGSAIGIVSGMIGVGGGIFLSPLLILLGWAGAKEAAATSALFIFANSLSGIAGRAQEGSFSPEFLVPLIAVSVVGAYLGSLFGAKRVNEQIVRRLLATVLLIAAGKHLIWVLGL